MQKRYQVLLPDWLEEYIKWGSEKYDLSFSELIRLEICLSVLASLSELYPQFKPELTLTDVFKKMKVFVQGKMGKEEVERIISKIYFETRKAVEYRMEKEKRSKKK